MSRRCFFELLLLIGIFSSSIQAKAQDQSENLKPVAKLISQYKLSNTQLRKANLFTLSSVRSDEASTILKKFTVVNLDEAALTSLLTTADGGIELTIPFESGSITVELVKVNLFTEDFKVVTDQSNNEGVAYQPGLYYRGIVKGDNQSLVSFSFFDHDVEGIISTDAGNTVVGKLRGNSSETEAWIVYSDRDFISPLTTSCATYDDPAYNQKLLQNILSGGTSRTDNCARLYYEVDNDIYMHNGSSIANASNWITAVHNNVAAIYSNDNINIALSEVFIWTMADPYNATNSITQLNLFKTYRASFNGDAGQLVSIEPGTLGGVASLVNALCSDADKYCYSDVDYEYSSVPTYSWTVNVVAHEFGHLLGSFHTHNCSWPGGAIDDCGPLAGYPNEGTCPLGPDPVNGGTIMSYCHLTDFGINFINGFGPLPANSIRGAIDAATCLSSSCVPNPPSYCLSVGKTNSEWIQSVQVLADNFINNSGAGGGYSDFTNQPMTLQPGSVVSIMLTPGYAGTHYKEYFVIWIDYNKDLDFYDGNETVYQSPPTNVPITANFSIPLGLTGTTRMRISMKFDSLPSPCESFKYGEVEDYTVSFVPPIIYCGSKGKNASAEWIDYVKLASLERISGSDSGYFDGTAASAVMTLNSSNTISFSAGFQNKPFNEYWKIWIDYNNDGIFKSTEKIVNRASSKQAEQTKTFTVPSTAHIGKTRMRISMKRHSEQNPCDTFAHGEVEDYSIIIVPEEVALTAPAGIISAKIFPNPASSEITVDLNGEISSGHIEVIDLSGRILQSVVIPENAASVLINVQQLSPAIYFLRIISPGKAMMTQKWIKE